MNRKECRETRREIDQSEVHQPLSDAALAHIKLCASCRDFGDERARLRDLVGSLEPVIAPADFDVRLRARMAAQRQNNRQWFFSGFAMGLPATVAAAVIVMLVGSVVWVAQRSRTQAPTIASAPAKGAKNTSGEKPGAVTNQSNALAGTPATTAAVNPITGNVARNRPLRPGRRPVSTALAKGPGVQSRDLSESPVQSIRSSENPGEVSLSAPVRPMVVSMQDDRGATRKISLPPVSFGSQRLVDNRIPASAGSRVW